MSEIEKILFQMRFKINVCKQVTDIEKGFVMRQFLQGYFEEMETDIKKLEELYGKSN